jgi:rare lipoprotein A
MPPALAQRAASLLALALLAGCGTGSGGKQPSLWPFPSSAHKPAVHAPLDPDLPRLPAASSGRGGYYLDDGPGDNPPPNLREVADAEVRAEPYSKYANRPYTVFGKTYVPVVNDEPFVQRGVSSWYGKKFHGQRTASGELYDMYKMTAAHPTLPIPSYARVTSIGSGKQVVVRINDRGPFHAGRVIDVSFTAALKLGLLGKGRHEVDVERLLPSRDLISAAQRRNAPEAPPSAFYLQLGAFARADKAEQARARLRNNASVRGVLEVVKGGSLHRLFSGPFASRGEADEALRALQAAGLEPMVVRR